MTDAIRVINGDCLEVMAALKAEGVQVDAVVTDPPYHLTSIVKRFGKAGSAPAKASSSLGSAYARASKGFMGKEWDGGDVAFQVETWRRVYALMKPGAHLVAFSGTRTYHRMAVAIEDAGFEIRDQLAWMYGTGFPKSLDIGKAIDKRKNWTALPKLQGAIKIARERLRISQSEAARRCGLIERHESLGGGGFMWFETGMRVPTREQWPRLKAALGLGGEFDQCFEEAEREITGTVEEWTDRTNYALTSRDGFRRDKPASELAAQWDGWGTALKPSWEPIVLARKPIDADSIAANVLKHGTGAINIGDCAVGDEVRSAAFTSLAPCHGNRLGDADTAESRRGTQGEAKEYVGRWPANVLHDGSDDVAGVLGLYAEGAVRFFYSAKADAADRFGTKHPTVKPVDLMAYLVRLITPPGGLVLDCFAGSGTTGMGALAESARAILIERDPEYYADIMTRLEWARGDGKHSLATKARRRDAPSDALPLFSTPKDAAE